VAFAALADFHIIGQENFPASGPLIVVANHFSYLDPVAMVRAVPWPLEFIGGLRNPGAPATTRIIPWLWGYYPVVRGTGSRYALTATETVLKQSGIIGIFPEGGNWATVLRPARPGTAYLAARTGAPILPIGFDGLLDVFPQRKQGKRARITVQVGKLFGPFSTTGRGRQRREQLEEIGHEIMRRIAELIPPPRRGHYSDDPAIRTAAQGTEIYPWTTRTEEEFEAGEHLADL
jgi:1-acyl-sn-glycerol-3-phosphate acyltransferase